MYQGFSVSFDMWCEETWISYSVGATLYVADAATAKSVDELAAVLRSWQITILHAVPSLLAVMDGDVPTLRMINAGGEACTPQVLNEWAKPGRVFYNSYGPTETTGNVHHDTALQPGDPITIGDPLPNYNLAVMDEAGNILPARAKRRVGNNRAGSKQWLCRPPRFDGAEIHHQAPRTSQSFPATAFIAAATPW